MSKVVKITSKGQITIPNKIRKELDLDKDSYLVMETIGSYVVMKKVSDRLQEISDSFQEKAREKKLTRRDLEEALLEARSEVWSDE